MFPSLGSIDRAYHSKPRKPYGKGRSGAVQANRSNGPPDRESASAVIARSEATTRSPRWCALGGRLLRLRLAMTGLSARNDRIVGSHRQP